MFSLVPSVFLRRSYFCVLCCSILFLGFLPCNIFIKIGALLVMIALGITLYRKQLMTLEFIKLKQLDKENWLLQTSSGHIFQGRLYGDSLINSIFSIVVLKSNDNNQTKKLLICRDMLPAMQYHRLVLGLRGLL